MRPDHCQRVKRVNKQNKKVIIYEAKMKNIINELENSLDAMNNKIEDTEESISDKKLENSEAEQKREGTIEQENRT